MLLVVFDTIKKNGTLSTAIQPWSKHALKNMLTEFRKFLLKVSLTDLNYLIWAYLENTHNLPSSPTFPTPPRTHQTPKPVT